MLPKKIKLMAEYGLTVLWHADGVNVGPIDPDTLPLPDELKTAINDWAEKYDATLNHDYPPDSCFATEEDKKKFEIEGRRIWQAMKETLFPNCKVNYYSETESRLLEEE